MELRQREEGKASVEVGLNCNGQFEGDIAQDRKFY